MHVHKICYVVLFVHTYVHTIIVTAEQLDDIKNNKNCSHYIYYYVHTQPVHQEEKNQLTAITQHLLKREETSPDHLDILVEQPLSVATLFDSQPRVTSSLETVINNNKFNKTHVVPSEIRCASLAAMFILQKKIDPRSIFPKLEFELNFENKHVHYIVKNLTFSDVIQEYSYHKERLNGSIQSICKQEPPLEKSMKMVDNYFEDFLKTLKQHEIEKDTHILMYAKTLKNKSDEDTRERPWNSISLPFSRLFEIHLFNKMYKGLHNNKKMMLIAGALHALQVSQMLRTTGMDSSKFVSNGFNPYENSRIPLTSDQLDLFKKESSWMESCIIL